MLKECEMVNEKARCGEHNIMELLITILQRHRMKERNWYHVAASSDDFNWMPRNIRRLFQSRPRQMVAPTLTPKLSNCASCR